MVSECAVAVELSNLPLVRLSGCLDVREFWASLCWQCGGARWQSGQSEARAGADLFFPTAPSV